MPEGEAVGSLNLNQLVGEGEVGITETAMLERRDEGEGGAGWVSEGGELQVEEAANSTVPRQECARPKGIQEGVKEGEGAEQEMRAEGRERVGRS